MPGALPALRPRDRTLPGWLPAALLVGGTALIGPQLGSVMRPLFILGCGGAAWFAWRRGAGAHLQAVLLMLAFAPFLRRLVDLAVGFDTSGIMLVGPLLAMLVPGIELTRPSDRPASPILQPILLVAACTLYASFLTIVQGDWMNAASGSVKWFSPLVYAAVLLRTRETPAEILQAAAAAFLVILPVIGLYGVYQYVDPPAWDRFWMNYASIMSAGQPVPFGVRTFSTMNGPGSFATFTAVGLVVMCFLRPGWQSLACGAPAALSLLLSMYRTGWISLIVGVLFCALFAATRPRAVGMLCGSLAAVVLAGLLTPFGEVIGDRLASFSEGSKDGSAQERLEQFVTIWNQPDSGLVGNGFTNTDVGSAGAMAIDGTIMSCWITLGIVGGILCIAGLVWAAGIAIAAAFRDGGPEAAVVGALALGALTQMPLASIVSGELGFLFWTFVVLLPRPPAASPEFR